MTREEFFIKICGDNATTEQAFISLLEARGFLIEHLAEGFYLSDNGHDGDGVYLNQLLEKYGLGFVDGRRIVVTGSGFSEFIDTEFREGYRIGKSAEWSNGDWRWFKNHEYGTKAVVSDLEPFIARYIKAISACAVITISCCDGNHPGKREMLIKTSGMGSMPWHRLICEKCLVDRFNINWAENYAVVRFSNASKYDTYYAVNMAADLLYRNRKEIRRIKKAALEDLSNSYLRNHSPAEIEKEFIGRAAELFESSAICF